MPKYSVVVPTYSRPRQLTTCLESLRELDASGGDFEVIVVDDGSPAPLDAVVDSFRAALEVRLIRQVKSGPAAARNTGAKAALGRYVAFTDDDCAPAREWLREFDRVFAGEPRCLAGGGIVNALPENTFSTATQTIMTAVYRYYDEHPECERLLSASNMAVAADDFRQLGGFSESFPLAAGEDYDFCHRWLRGGRPIRYASAAVVSHAHSLTFAAFCRQHFRYGRGLSQFHARAAQRVGRSILGNRPGFHRHLLGFPLQHQSGWRKWGCAALVALAQAATLAGACYERGLARYRASTAATSPASRRA
jgi:glycosyltransferase involved in cell wall biosynthesis